MAFKFGNVKTDRAKENSEHFVNSSKNVHSDARAFEWIVFPVLGDWQLQLAEAAALVVDQRSEVESWDVGNGRQRHKLHNNSQDLVHRRQDQHNVELHRERNRKLQKANAEGWVNIGEVFTVIDAVFHHHESLSDIFLHVDVHQHGTNESSAHQI